MTLVTDAVIRMAEGLLSVPPGIVWRSSRASGETVQLRFEFEADADFQAAVSKAGEVVIPDLENLVVNGNTESREDPLLMVLDGSEKRGKSLKDFDISKAVLYPPVSQNPTRYVLYLIISATY